MHQDIQFNRLNIKKILLFGLVSSLHALPYTPNMQVGLGYESKNAIVKESPFTDLDVITIPIKQKNIQKILHIKNLEQLLNELGYKKDFSLFKSKLIGKLLDNNQINDYTHTYLIYVKSTAFQKKFEKYQKLQSIDKNFNQIYGDSYIDSISIGGEYIGLIHIKTNSENDYKKIDKQLNKNIVTWDNIDTFTKNIEKISKTHRVIIKNILSKKQELLPATNLMQLIQNAKAFSSLLHGKEIPYYVEYKAYTTFAIDVTYQNFITTYLKAINIIHNYAFIRRNIEQFQLLQMDTTYKQLEEIVSKIQKEHANITLEEMQSYTKKLTLNINHITYPKRYSAFLGNKSIQIPTMEFDLSKDFIEKKYPKITEDMLFTIQYTFMIQIKNSGKVAILNWQKKISANDEIIHESKNSKIILDTFVEYKDLKIQAIKNNDYGSLTYKTKFDKYEKKMQISGNGIVREADCSYSIIDNNGTLQIGCSNIIFNPIEMEFRHIK